MKKEQLVAMTLSVSMLLSANAAAAAATDFSDFPSGWSATALNHAIENGLLQGSDGKINPDGLVTRAQMSAIVARALGAVDHAPLSEYHDVDLNAWYADPMGKAVAMGAFRGDGDQLRPNAPINRQEAFNVLARIFSLEDGREEVLHGYSDFHQLSDWAKSGVSAMVQSGYVQGNGVTLNPKATMTRAELAQVMDRMVAAYLTGASGETVPEKGNVVLRGNQTLKNAAIDGDLVIGDGAEEVNLDGVTVKGRILIRGGSRNVTLSGTKAQGGVIVDNAGKTATLTVSYGDPGVVVVKSDLRLNGSLQEIQVTKPAQVTVEKGASVQQILVKAKNVRITGDGQVSKVQTEADNTTVSTGNTTVNVAAGVIGTVAGGVSVKPGESMVTGSASGSSSSGHSSRPNVNPNPNPTPNTDPDVKPQKNKLVEEARVVDLGWSRYLTVRFAEGKNLQNTTLSVDGVTINPAVTPVTDDGSVVKWEVTALNHANLVVTSGQDSQTISLGAGQGAAPTVTAETGPDYFLLNGPVYIWDYHLTNYDDAGNVRVTPSKTTFDLGGKTDRVAAYSPDAVVYADEQADNVYKVRGMVELMFNYASGTEADRAFVDEIKDVDLVSFDENKTTLNSELHYEIDKKFVHGDHTVACIRVPLGQTNFYSNGRYNLRVTSNGTSALYPIHVVQEKVPSLTYLNSEDGRVRFRVNDMTYGITSPIYRVDLTDVSGQTRTLAKFDDWFLIGDMLVLYHDKTNHFPADGNYTVTVYANGFQTFSKQFFQNGVRATVQETMQPETPRMVSLDAVSSASINGGSGGSSEGGGGGSKVMNANLVVDADLMVNAKLLGELGIPNQNAEGVAERWNMSKRYVFNQGAEDVYTAEGYFDAVNTARTQNVYLTFADYIASGKAETTQNRPGAVKQILEDNLLGMTTSFRDMAGMEAPKLTLTEQGGEQAVFTCADEAYLTKLAASGELFLNTTYPAMGKHQYTVENGKLTISGVKAGRNILTVRVPGYQTVEVTFEIEKKLEEVQLTAAEVTKGNPVVVTCEAEHDSCDFLANLIGVKMVAPNGAERTVRIAGGESVLKEIGYTVSGHTLTIGKDIFDEAFAKGENGSFLSGRYQVVLIAEYYGEQTLAVHVTDNDLPAEPEGDLKAPVVLMVEQNLFRDYKLTFGRNQDAYMNAITGISVNGTPYSSGFVNNNTGYSILKTDGIVNLGSQAFQKNASNTVVISAKGYQPLTLTIVLDEAGKPAADSEETKPEEKQPPMVRSITENKSVFSHDYTVAFAGDAKEVEAFLEATTKVTAGGTQLNKAANFFHSTKSYQIASDPVYGGPYCFMKFTADCFEGEVEVVLEAEGYQPLTFTVKDGKMA